MIKIIGYSLPVSFKKVIEKVPQIIQNHKPKIFIGLGLAGGRPSISIERVAINIMDSASPDIDGFKPDDKEIINDGPVAYFSTLPIKRILKSLHAAKIPAIISNSAETYVCNALMYIALHTIASNNLPTLGGFIHLPFLPEQVLDKQQPSMSLDLMLRAVNLVIEETLNSLKTL